MPPIRFRIWTIMVVVASVAVLTGSIRVLLPIVGISVESAEIRGSTVWIPIDSMPVPEPPGSSPPFGQNYVVIPVAVVLLAPLLIALFALAVYYLSSRRRRVIGSGMVDRRFRKSNPDRSEEAERV
jgi:hypothetical protein